MRPVNRRHCLHRFESCPCHTALTSNNAVVGRPISLGLGVGFPSRFPPPDALPTPPAHPAQQGRIEPRSSQPTCSLATSASAITTASRLARSSTSCWPAGSVSLAGGARRGHPCWPQTPAAAAPRPPGTTPAPPEPPPDSRGAATPKADGPGRPMVVQRPGLLVGQVDHRLHLPGPLADRQDLDAGMQRAAVGMGGGPCLHRGAWPSTAAGGGGFGRWEIGPGAGQHDDSAAGDAKDPGSLRRRDELGAAGRDGTLPGAWRRPPKCATRARPGTTGPRPARAGPCDPRD
jgi:hypothetical protein